MSVAVVFVTIFMRSSAMRSFESSVISNHLSLVVGTSSVASGGVRVESCAAACEGVS